MNINIKVDKKKLNFLYLFFVLSSLIITLVSFLSWNNKTLSSPPNIVFDLEHYYVDTCVFKNGYIKLIGWAFTVDESSAINRVFAYKKNGDMAEIMTTVQRRPDISKFYNEKDMYDRSGFTASKMLLKPSDFSGTILVTSQDYKGVTHAAKYDCK